MCANDRAPVCSFVRPYGLQPGRAGLLSLAAVALPPLGAIPTSVRAVRLFAQAHLHVVALRSLLAQDGSSIMGDGAGAAVLETWAAGLQRFEQMTGSLLLSSRQMIAAVCVPFVTLVAAAARTRICSGCCAIGVAASARVCCSHHRPPASGRRPALGKCGGAPVGVLVLSRRRWRRHAALRRLCGIVV